MSTLYDYLEDKAFERNMTMEQLAHDIGISKATMSRIKYRAPSQTTYHKIGHNLDISPVTLRKMSIEEESTN
jgi:DNA-binding XRE family transcriptional regulator